MSQPWLYDNEDAYSMYQAAMMQRGGVVRHFDEYYRCYPVAMLPGPERESANHGGKVFLPASALEKLTRLHITYPMLFEIINGAKEKQTHAGVLEFIAEEGKIYLPYWLMQTLLLEAGDLVQIKSSDLPPGTFIKLQPQSPEFLDITDPKAVLENAFRNFSCMTTGDVFSFAYNDNVYEIAVLEVKPDTSKHAICTMETDLSVDFAPPIGYVEPTVQPAKSKQSASTSDLHSGTLHGQGTMAKAINYDAIAPNADAAATGARAVSSYFKGEGRKLAAKRGSKASSSTATPARASTPANNSAVTESPSKRTTNGPQPLRLAPGKLFFGYPLIPLRKTGEKKDGDSFAPHFQGQGQTLRRKKGGDASSTTSTRPTTPANGDGSANQNPVGRTLKDNPR